MAEQFSAHPGHGSGQRTATEFISPKPASRPAPGGISAPVRNPLLAKSPAQGPRTP